MSKKNGNIRRKRRSGKNLFWLVRHTRLGSKFLILYNREPFKWDWSEYERGDNYNGKFLWFSSHGESYLGKQSFEKFSDITWQIPIKVKLIVVPRDANPDMYIQRVGENLFIDCMILKYTRNGKEQEEVNHSCRISNKLFPEITEESGIVGVNVERI